MISFSPTGRMLIARGLYRAWLAKYFSTVSLAGLTSDDEPILLRKIYVPLILTEERVAGHEAEQRLHRGGSFLPGWLASPLGENVFLISGEAGSGKTTLVSAIVDSFVGEVGDDLNLHYPEYVPFPIRLREAPLETLNSLSELVEWWLSQARAEIPGLEAEALIAFLDNGQGFLLLDGLDEVGNLARRSRVMRWLRKHPWIRRGRELSIKTMPVPVSTGLPPNLVIVTARPSGFEGLENHEMPPHRRLFVAPFSHEQIRAYLTRWFELRPLRSEQRQSTVENLINRLTSSGQAGRLLPLARRPAYLASLAFVHGTRGELPYTRAALYEQLVEAYIEMLDRQKGILDRDEEEGELPVWDRQEKIEVLSAVAFQAHVGATTRLKNVYSWGEDRRFLWSREELEDAVRVAVEGGADRFRSIRLDQVTQLTSYFVARTGLLVEAREGQYQFGHLSFQEYLTALFLLNRATAESDKASELKRILFPRLGEPGWLEVGILVLAIDANRSGGKGHQPVLAQLNLNELAQLSFLGQLLRGEEIRFTSEERRVWVLLWHVFWSICNSLGYDEEADPGPILQFPRNQVSLYDAWVAAVSALAEGRSAFDGLKPLIERALVDLECLAQPIQRNLDTLVESISATASRPESTGARKAWSFINLPEDQDLFFARLLATPLLGGFIPDVARGLLKSVPSRVKLFVRPELGQLEPTHIGYCLNSWSFVFGDLFLDLMERTPLLWRLQDEHFAIRANSATLQSDVSALSAWRDTIWALLVHIEQLWWVSLLRAENPSRDRAWVLSSRSQAREWAIGRDGYVSGKRNAILPRTYVSYVDLPLLRAQTVARNWCAQSTTQDLALALALARALHYPDDAREMVRYVSPATSQWIRYLEYPLQRLLSILDQSNFRPGIRVGDLFHAAIQGIALGWLSNDSSPAQSFDSSLTLDVIRQPDRVTAPLQGTPFLDKALQEWEEVLASPFSPLPLLEDILRQEWRELPTDTDAIALLFGEALARQGKNTDAPPVSPDF